MSELLRPVPENQRTVTDQSVLSLLTAKGVDKSDVEFAWDYCGSYPRTKKYVNKKTGERILVSSNLPMARPDDNSVVVPLFTAGENKWYIGNNLFEGEVSENGRIALSPVVAQPNGLRPGDEVVWEPVLYLDSEAVEVVSGPALLETDPINSNYGSNVLRWDYGICERLIRLIEGRLCERWIFAESPGGVVRIVHNHIGQFRLGPYAIDGDIEQVTVAQFSAAQFPLVVSATLTVYPDANPESATVDGFTMGGTGEANLTWAQLRGHAGYWAEDTYSAYRVVSMSGSGSYWVSMYRGLFLFDTSALTDAATVTDGVFSLFRQGRGGNNASAKIRLVSSAPASNTQLVAGDFDSLGTTLFSENYYTCTGSGSPWGDSAVYKDFTLNTAGKAAVSKTGITKFGVREGTFDIANSEPSPIENVCQFMAYFSEQGAGYKPKLVLTYSTGWSGGKVGGVSSSGAGKVGGVDLSNVGKIGGVS